MEQEKDLWDGTYGMAEGGGIASNNDTSFENAILIAEHRLTFLVGVKKYTYNQ